MTAVIHKISVGGGGKHILSPEESFHRSEVLGNYVHNRSRANTRAFTVAKIIKNACSNACNCCNRILWTQRQRL